MRERGVEFRGDPRGISNLVGVVLLIGMAITGAVLVAVIGASALNETEQESRMQVAEQSMQEVSSQFHELKVTGEGGRASLTLPDDTSGDISVVNTTTVTLLANGNESCSSGPVPMGTVLYDNPEEGIVGYEAGGIWRQTDDGSTWMVSSPDVEYRNGRLALQISDMQGFVSGNGKVSAAVDERESAWESDNISRALSVNRTAEELRNGVGPVRETCEPSNVENVTVSIRGSQFARAWYNFATQNFDDRLVTVEQRSVIEAGDPINITYLLGEHRDPEYQITDVDAPASTREGTDMTMDVTVENVGDFNGTAPITLYNETGGIAPVELATTSQRIVAGTSETVTLTVEAADLNSGSAGAANYTTRVETPDDNVPVEFVVGSGSPADLGIQSLSSPADAELGDDRDLSVTVENTGGTPAGETVRFYYADEFKDEAYVWLDDGDTETLSFDVPTTREGDIPLKVNFSSPSEPDHERTTTITIGDLPDFELESATGPFRVTQNTPYEIDATVENEGSTEGTRPVEIEVRNASNPGDTVYTDIRPLTLTPHETRTITFRNDSGIAAPGLYEYVVETDGDTETGTFRVGSIAEPFFVTTQATTDRSVVQEDGSFNITGAVQNAGGTNGTQEVTVSFEGSEIGSESITLTPGEAANVGPFRKSLAGSAPGTYEYTIESENTSVSGQILVVEEFDGDFDSGDSTIAINQSITARLTVLGTELSGIAEAEHCETRGNWWDGYYEVCEPGEIIRAPVEMAIYTDNATAPDTYHRVWGDKDLNTPQTRRDQIDGGDYLSKEITVTATEDSPTNVSVFAESFTCDHFDGTGLTRQVDGYGELEGMKCDDPDPDSRIDINQDENPSNLVIREDGETVPAFGQAGAEQRDVREILGDRITDEGVLQLEDDQLALFYELSQENADPDDAMGTNDDPDYNDAVVLFEVVAENHTPSVPGLSDVVINDTTGPATVNPPYDDSFEVEVWNRGGDEVDDAVNLAVDGSERASVDVSLDGRESKWVEVDVPSGLSSGNHEIEFSVDSDENETATRNLYVGEATGPYFLPNVEYYDEIVRPGELAEVRAHVTNVGDNQSTQDVTANVVGVSGDLDIGDVVDPDQEWSDLTLGSGSDDIHSFAFESSAEGQMTIEVATENASTRVNVTVMDPRLEIERAIVGDQTYREGDTIVSSNLESLTADVSNPAAISRSGNVELYMRESDSGASFTHIDTSSDVTLNGNRTLVKLDLTGANPPLGPDVNSQTGLYDYELRTDPDGVSGTDDVQSGEIQIITPEDSTTSTDPDYITVDMNQIELS
ncbi:DUF7289 family protein [Halorientalis halophila]|uniref:DUF7289 family protein n=1 Tax=Halorientalis halophila TaxID=3108499 RepID=UPI00300B582F